MRKLLLFAALLIPILAFPQARFDRMLNIPVTEGTNTLTFPWAGGINFPKISSIDLNMDGLDDLFLFDNLNNRILTFSNNGSTDYNLAWDYAPQYAFQFPPVNSWAFLYDYNCDGKSDFFTFSSSPGCAGIAAYKNISTPGNPLQWTIVDSCLDERYVTITQHIFTNSIALPHFNDIDGDGDMDILGYNTIPNGRILFHKNYSMENYGTCDSLDFVLESLCWGNFQLKIGGSNSVGCFHCPCRQRRPSDTGSKQFMDYAGALAEDEPSYDQSDAARRDDTVSGIFALDTDGDNFKELLVGDIASINSLMVHNDGGEMDLQDTLFPSYDVPALFNGFHYHAFIDVDNDNKKDLLVISNEYSNKNSLLLYKNNGTTSIPVFNHVTDAFLQGEMIDVGENACPVFFDYDNDNLLDLVISKGIFDNSSGQYLAGLFLYRNTGTTTNPSFNLVTTDFAGLTAQNLYQTPVYPAFGDLDNDGDKDMLVGLEDGRIHYFDNTAGPGNPATFSGPVANYMGIDVGRFATPQLYDLDHDGLLDIICGSQRGFVNYFNNRGSLTSPLYNSVPTNDSLGCIALQGNLTTDGFTVPFLYDSSGVTRLLVAWEKGNVYQYNNIDGNINGCFNYVGNVYSQPESSRIKFNITVSGGNLNGDSLTDIIIGQSTGGAEIRYQVSPTSNIPIINLPRPTFDVFPNPVKNEMHIRFYNLENNKGLLRVYNSIGELVTEKNIQMPQDDIKTSSWSSGVYFVQLISERNIFGKKVVVSK